MTDGHTLQLKLLGRDYIPAIRASRVLNPKGELESNPVVPVLVNFEWRSPDILIGGNFYHLFKVSTVRSLASGADVLSSIIGYGLFGPLPSYPKATTNNDRIVGSLTNAIDPCLAFPDSAPALVPALKITRTRVNEELRKDLERIWRWDLQGLTPDPCISDDDKALEHFESTIKFIDSERRYEAAFPMIEGHPPIPSNREYVKARFISTFRQLAKNPKDLADYNAEFEKYKARKAIEVVTEEDLLDPNCPPVFNPHHRVRKDGKNVRPVFDASASSAPGQPSVNQCMYRGPIFTPELVGLMSRFRLKPFIVIADIEAAFHTIIFAKFQRNLSLFYWVDNIDLGLPESNIRIYRRCRIPFGYTASPFVLLATIRTHLKRENTPLATELLRNTYVDNLLVTAYSREEAKKKAIEPKALFAKCSMNVRYFVSNDTDLNKELAEIFSEPEPEPLTSMAG